VNEERAARETAAALRRDPGRLDVLINNAAAYVDWTELASAADLSASEQVLSTNLFGPWRTIQALLPLLRESPHPRIVNVSSGAGSHGDEQFSLTRRGGAAASYGISKAAQNALTATLAAELADTPILVNAVCPGLTATWPGAEQMGARLLVKARPQSSGRRLCQTMDPPAGCSATVARSRGDSTARSRFEAQAAPLVCVESVARSSAAASTS
jgi:NAD(P)-dependent dehydrogenase (short-subunit alcohol dehydrogenase family)